MIYKPISAYPIRSLALSTEENNIEFALSGIYGSKILDSYIRVGVTGNNDPYKDYDNFSYYESTNNIISYNDDSYNIQMTVENSDIADKYNSSKIYGKKLPRNIDLGWKVRLYEKDSYDHEIKSIQKETITIGTNHYYSEESYPFRYGDSYHEPIDGNHREGWFNYEKAYNYAAYKEEITDNKYYIATSYIPTNWVGYGAVSSAGLVYITKESGKSISYSESYTNGNTYRNYGTNYKLLQIFPHDFHNSNMVSTKVSNRKEYISNYDSQYARYYIKIKGVYYKILDWRYYNWAKEGDGIENDRFTSTYTDGYGNPLSMYVLIRTDDNFTCDVDTEYTIYCNYIDSDFYSLEINDTPTLSFKDLKFPDNEIQFYDSENEALNEANILTMAYSDLDIVVDYKQSNGAYVSKYDVKLCLIDENNNKSVVDEVFNKCTQFIHYKFDEFKNGEKYILQFRITDNKGMVYNKYLCIAPKYGTESRLVKVNLTPANGTNKMRIDFSHVFSIYPDETAEGSYSFENDETAGKYLSLNSNNSLTYRDMNDTDNLKIPNFFMNFTIKLHHDFDGEIITASDDYNNSYTLSWDGIKFIYSVTANTGNVTVSEYYPYDLEVSSEIDISNNPWLSAMMDNMSTDVVNTNVPYIWNEAFSEQLWNSDLYIHDEETSKEYWWSIVLMGDKVYFCNLTQNGEWHIAS